MRKALREAFAGFFAGRTLPATDTFEFPPELQTEIAEMAGLVVRARSGVVREAFSSREIEFVPEPEVPTRLAKQLATLATALAVVEEAGAVTDQQMALIAQVAIDCIPQHRVLILKTLKRLATKATTSMVAEAVGYPTTTTRRILEDLAALGVTLSEKRGPGRPDEWQITDAAGTVLDLVLARASATIPEMSDHHSHRQPTDKFSPTLSRTDISGKAVENADVVGVCDLPETAGVMPDGPPPPEVYEGETAQRDWADDLAEQMAHRPETDLKKVAEAIRQTLSPPEEGSK
jgi:hypothetical protein